MTAAEWLREQAEIEEEKRRENNPVIAEYYRRLEFENSHIQLQGYGWHPALTGAEIEVGDVMVWNWGYTSEVINITTSKSGKTAEVTLKAQSNHFEPDREGKISTRRITMTAKYAVRKQNA